jgi:hypothetical protein
MKTKSSLLFFVIALALLAYIWFFERNQKTTVEQGAAEKKIFADLRIDALERLEFQQGAESVVLVRNGKKWKIEKPIATDAEEVQLNQTLNELEFGEVQRTISGAELGDTEAQRQENLKQMGLLEPGLKVRLVLAGKKMELGLGRKATTREAYFARKSGGPEEPVLLVGAGTYTALNKTLNDLRTHSVFGDEAAVVQRVGMRQAAEGVQPVRDWEMAQKDGEWQLQKPLAARVDGVKMNAWLAKLTGLRVAQFISDDSSDLATYGLNTPRSQVWFQAKEGEERALIVGAPVPGHPGDIYAKRLRQNVIFTVSAAEVKALVDGLADLRDKKFLSFAPGQVTRIKFEGAGRNVEATLKEGKWTLSDNATADTRTVEEFLNRLKMSEALSVVKDTASDLKPYGLDKPGSKLILGMKDPAVAPLELWLGKTDKKQVYAKNSVEPFILALDPKIIETWPKQNYQWRNREVIKVDVNQVKQLVIVGRDARSVTLQREKPGHYTVDRANYSVNVPVADAQISLLAQLRASSWLGAVVPAMGLSQPQIRFVLTTQDNAAVTVKIGAKLANGSYVAQVEGQDLAFELSASDFDLLDKMPVDSIEQKPTPATAPVSPH